MTETLTRLGAGPLERETETDKQGNLADEADIARARNEATAIAREPRPQVAYAIRACVRSAELVPQMIEALLECEKELEYVRRYGTTTSGSNLVGALRLTRAALAAAQEGAP